MADFSMWGPEASPARLIQQDAQQAMLRAAQTQHALATARDQNAQAAQREAEAEGERRMAAAMAKLGKDDGGLPGENNVNTPLTPAGQLAKMSQLAFDSGLASKGAKYAGEAALARAREASQEYRAAEVEKVKLETSHKELEHTSRLFSGVVDQGTFDRANALYAMQFGQQSPVAGQPYSRELVDRIQSYSSTQLERTRARMAEIDTASKVANRNSSIDFRNARKLLIEAQIDLAKAREERLAKVGGKDTVMGIPSPNERRAASRLLSSEFPALGKEADDLNLQSDQLAARARALMKGNKALTDDQARRQALGEMRPDLTKLNDSFSTMGKISKLFGGKKDSGPAGPLALPPNRSELKSGATYQTARGPAIWNGKGFSLPTAPAKAASSSLASIPGDEDGDGVPDDEE